MYILDKIKSQITNNTVVLYMKGSPEIPLCGFSAKVVNILQSLKVKFAYVNVLENIQIRKMLPQYADWPTFPQLYINGELIGGCDIVTELYDNKSLLKKFEKINCVEQESSTFYALK